MESPVTIPQNLIWGDREHAEAIREVHYQANGIFYDVLDEIKQNVSSRIPQCASPGERAWIYRDLAKEGFEKWKSLVSERFKDNPSARDLLLVRAEKHYRLRFHGHDFTTPLEEIFQKTYPPAPDIANVNQKV